MHRSCASDWGALRTSRITRLAIHNGYKARLIDNSFTKNEGIDYHETFSLVSKKASFRIIMALIAYLDLELHQMNVKTTFLKYDFEEEVYIK